MLARVAGSVAATMATGQQRGAVLDFEALAPGDLPALTAVVRALADTLRAHQLGPVVLAIPATDTLAYPGRPLLDAGADLLLPMLYDQHWAGGEPGPVAEPRWVDSALAIRVAEVGAARLVAGLPLYGYRWSAAGQGTTVTFAEASRSPEGPIALVRDSATGSLRGAARAGGEVWVTDAPLLRELVAVVERHGVHRLALWYVGQEDPAVWSQVFPRRAPAAPR
jgi:spore germination protein YaaH